MKRSPRTTLAVAASAVIITVLTSGTASADLREDFEALATAIEATGQSETAAQLRAAVHALSDEQLDMIYADADLAGIMSGASRQLNPCQRY